MENHGGYPYYYLLVLLYQPNAVVRLPRPGVLARLGDTPEAAPCFLMVWAAVYLVIFSIASTKLPNYVLPAYPALALLTARPFLVRWSRDEETLPAWARRFGLIGLAGGGSAIVAGLLILGGAVAVRACARTS